MSDWMGPPCIPSDPHFVGESSFELIAFCFCVLAYSGCVFAAGFAFAWVLL